MKQNAYIAGVGMTRFGKHLDRGLKSLGAEAINEALDDAGIDKSGIQAAWMGNGGAAIITGQVLIPGQCVLRGMGIGNIPVVNVENACATSATAFQQAASMVTAGAYDVVLVCGTEKLYSRDKLATFAVFQGAVDTEDMERVRQRIADSARAAGSNADIEGAGTTRSMFMDIYASMARNHMRKFGSTRRHFAMVSAKNSFHGSMNPKAQYQEELTVEDVLAARVVVDPLTLPMCSPIGDGAAALVLVSEKKAREMGMARKVRVLSSVLASGHDDPQQPSAPELTIQQVYQEAGMGPEQLSVVELHDASAPAELIYYELLGLCGKGEGVRMIEDGETRLGGRLPVNTSGGLLRKGHPIGASGAGQLVELVTQLRGEAGQRQVEGARTALAENGGGFIGGDVAAIVISLLQKEG